MCKQLRGSIFLTTSDIETLNLAKKNLGNKNIDNFDTIGTLEFEKFRGNTSELAKIFAEENGFDNCITLDEKLSTLSLYNFKKSETLKIPAKNYIDGFHALKELLNSPLYN